MALVLLLAVVALAVAVPLGAREERQGGSAVVDRTSAAGRATTSPPSSTPPQTSASTPSTSPSTVPADRHVTEESARELAANEMGHIPVLMYHAIIPTIVPPQRLREDIALLKTAGFYPITIREMVQGRMDIPAGKSPVVLTFDDSGPSQYRILEDGELDPDCAVGVLQAAVAAGGWAPKATFFPLLYVDPPSGIVFGQPAHAEQKLRNLVEWGYEVGSHTVTHQNLADTTPGRIMKELAQSKSRLEAMIGGGYQVYTLSPPYGEYPEDESILASGEYEGTTYEYSAAVMAGGDSAPSPFSSRFRHMRIPRITAYPKNTVRDIITHFQRHHEWRFISDGDPDTVSVPEDLSEELGELRTDLDLRVVRY